jgi:hypothetical protein
MAGTVIGILLAIVFYIKGRKQRRVNGWYSTSKIVDDKQTSVEDLTVFYHGVAVKRLFVTRFVIRNTGNCIIERKDIYPSCPLHIKCDESANVLYARVIEQSSDTINCDIKQINDDNNLEIDYESIEKREYVVINIYHTDNTNILFLLDGKIKEGSIVNSVAQAWSFFKTMSVFACIISITFGAIELVRTESAINAFGMFFSGLLSCILATIMIRLKLIKNIEMDPGDIEYIKRQINRKIIQWRMKWQNTSKKRQ